MAPRPRPRTPSPGACEAGSSGGTADPEMPLQWGCKLRMEIQISHLFRP